MLHRKRVKLLQLRLKAHLPALVDPFLGRAVLHPCLALGAPERFMHVEVSSAWILSRVLDSFASALGSDIACLYMCGRPAIATTVWSVVLHEHEQLLLWAMLGGGAGGNVWDYDYHVDGSSAPAAERVYRGSVFPTFVVGDATYGSGAGMMAGGSGTEVPLYLPRWSPDVPVRAFSAEVAPFVTVVGIVDDDTTTFNRVIYTGTSRPFVRLLTRSRHAPFVMSYRAVMVFSLYPLRSFFISFISFACC